MLQNYVLVWFVGDPLAALRGTTAERKLYTAILVLVWEALGFELAYAKGQLSRTVTSIGGTLTMDTKGVKATVKESIIEDIMTDLVRFLGLNLVSKKELHSLLGKLGHAAGLLIIMRPFLDPLWAAWAAPDPVGHAGCIWTKQIMPELGVFPRFLLQDR